VLCTLCLTCTPRGGSVYLEALCQLLHVGFNVRVYAFANSNAIQARSIKQIRIIHLRVHAPGLSTWGLA
jgi:hypothetical protein